MALNFSAGLPPHERRGASCCAPSFPFEAFKSERLLGAVYYPAFGELYAAHQGKGAWLNGTPIRARTDDDIRRDDLLGLSTRSVTRMQVQLPCKVSSLGTAVASFPFVAKGSYIGGILTDNRVWDIAAGWVGALTIWLIGTLGRWLFRRKVIGWRRWS